MSDEGGEGRGGTTASDEGEGGGGTTALSEGGEGTTALLDSTVVVGKMEDKQAPMEAGRRAEMKDDDDHLATGSAVASDWPGIADSTAPPLQQMHDVKAWGLEIPQPQHRVEFVKVDENADVLLSPQGIADSTAPPLQQMHDIKAWELEIPQPQHRVEFVNANENAGVLPSPQETPMPSVPTCSAQVKDIWEETALVAFEEITALIKSGGKLVVGLDTEYAIRDGAVLPRVEPPTADEHYQQVCTIVNGGNLVQLALAIADARFHVIGTWQFNMKFSVKWREPGHPGVAFLRDKAKLNLEDHETHGINPSEFIVWLTRSGMLSNMNISWITFNGYSDYGFLVRLMDANDILPPKRLQFLSTFWNAFPRSYDVRVFTKLGRCRNTIIDGGLAKVCEALGVRIDGQTHHAGTDALSAIRCMEMMINGDPEFSQRMVKYSGVLYGLVVDGWAAIRYVHGHFVRS